MAIDVKIHTGTTPAQDSLREVEVPPGTSVTLAAVTQGTPPHAVDGTWKRDHKVQTTKGPGKIEVTAAPATAGTYVFASKDDPPETVDVTLKVTSNMPPPPVALRTYTAIRMGVVAVIVALGFAVWREIVESPVDCVQRSLSAYYYTPVRPVFVGALLIIGFAMIVMWGMTWAEDAALNLAGLLLTVVALVPTLDASYCSLAEGGQRSDTEKDIADKALILANHDEVSRSFTSFLVVLALILVFTAIAGAVVYHRAGSDRRPTKRAVIAYVVTWGLAAAAWVIYLVLFQDAKDPESAFNHQVHSWSANLGVGLIMVAVVLAAIQKARSDDAAKTKWVWFYGIVAAAMLSTALVIKGGDRLDLFSRWDWVDEHATFLVEAILIALIGIFWTLQTIDRRKAITPRY